MLRAVAKAALLGGFGRVPGGAGLYQTITREWAGTQGTHVDKLARVWPGYVEVWSDTAGLELPGLRTWIHEGGWTPFGFMANYLLTGDAGVVTNVYARVLDRYVARAVNGVLDCGLPASAALDSRLRDVEALRWSDSAAEAIQQIGGALFESVDVKDIPIDSESIDLCHTGGVLEHYRIETLQEFLQEAARILRPGAVMSHVFDHRDHLHHADGTWPYLWHLGLSAPTYEVLFGHRLLFHNRLLPGEVAQLFEDAGFEQIAIRRMRLSDHAYFDSLAPILEAPPGIARERLARRFSGASDADLRTAAAHYLYRKPTAAA